ncbi:Ribonuclease inhibitor (Ribonuclease/angiogenin inhibitor 1), partial [Durusdinium trenchii]
SRGIKPHEDIMEILNEGETPDHITVDADLGPVGVQTLIEALVGDGEGLGGPFKLINTLRLWRSNAGEEGCRAVGAFLETGSADPEEANASDNVCNLQFLQLMDCNVTPQGCRYLGRALQVGANKTLLTLNLDHNSSLGTVGLRELANGMCTNSTIKRLSLAYCGIDSTGGRAVKNLLNGLGSQLEELVLKGNRLQGAGLKAFCPALGQNKVVQLAGRCW